MKVFRYFEPAFLLCVLQLLVEFPCQGETHLGHSNVKSTAKNSIPRQNGNKNALEKDLNQVTTLKDITGDNTSSPEKGIGSSGFLETDKSGSHKEHNINHKKDVNLHMVAKADDKFTKPSARTHQAEKPRELKNKTVANGKSKSRLTHSKKSKLTNNSLTVKPDDFHQKGTTKKKKKKLFKKYALVQSFSPLQTQSVDYQPIATGGQEALAAGYSPLTEGDQTANVKDQDPSQQQQQFGDGNSISQYDSAGYQQDNSQPAIANFVSNNGEEAGQREGTQQPTSLEQAIQLQQEAYTQQPQEQGQEQDNTRPGTEGADLGGQASQMIDGGQLQYQSEEAGQSQQQGAQEGAPEQGGTQTDFDQGGFQQGQTQELSQQQSQGFDEQLQQQQQQQQQQQDQAQEYQQQQQQPSEESSETQSFTTSTNSLGSLFGTEGQQTTAEQQGQGTVTYTNEQPGEGGDKSGPPGVQYASSIEEALKEPSVSPQDSSSEGDSQASLGANDGGNVINIAGGSDSREGSNNGFIGAGTVSAPSGYQTAAIDDNGNNDQTVTGAEVNGYAPLNDQGSNSDATALEESQQSQGTTSVDNQNSFNFAGEQFQQAGLGQKMPSLDDDFNKIVDIANKNGPMAVKGCKGCPPHARCIDKVCIINDDQPLAHILNALSGPEPGEESPPSECKECHYNAKCIQRECVCKAGYTGDGFDCRPDTCLPGCKQHGKCIKGFCVCDHHHYFNGYECAPYKITHRNCPLQCDTKCHVGCPPNCCKRHRVLKIHYNDGNLQEINVPSNAPPQKNATTPRPTVVVLKPEGKVNEHLANFASDFQQRPADSEATNLEAVNLKNPAGGFAVSEMAARPLVEDEAECPAQCKSECRDSCPVRCCLGKCPFSCLENCQPSCPRTCCYLPEAKHPIPMMDPQVQENFMKTMAEKFCPRACRAKCNSNCPPICCEVNSTHPSTLESADIQKLKGESKNSADFFRNAMSWFGMMNFLNMMYNMYGNLYGTKHFAKFPVKAKDHKLKTFSPTKPKTTGTENYFNIKEVGVAEIHNKANDVCPDYCNKSCLHICPTKCCRDKSEGKTLMKVGNPLKCLPSCALYCSKTCSPLCCSKNTSSSLPDHHPTEQIKIANSSPVSQTPRTQAPASSLPKPPAACTPICPAYCYPKCLESCCQRGEVTSKKLSQQPVTPEKAKQSYNNFFAKEPPLNSLDCPSVCRRDCGPSCPLRCCGMTSPTPTRLVATRPSINTPLCPGGCASECFPACTISCCRAGFKNEHSNTNVPAVSPTRRERQPGPNPPSFPLPPPAAVCHSGCSRSCYPNCDESCCRAYLERSSGFSDLNKLADSSHFTIKVPCPSECRPFNCLYYCHHDCCLPRGGTTILKKRRYQDQRKYFRDMRKVKAPTKPMLDKSSGGRISNRRTVIHKRPTH